MWTQHRLQRIRTLEASGGPLSRNAAFDAFEDPGHRDALRLRRRLRGLARELRRGKSPAFVRSGEGDRVELHFVDKRARFRQSLFLTRAEIAYILALDPDLGALLDEPQGSPRS
jgi:hypothetical protein